MLDWLKRTYRYYNTILELAVLKDDELKELGINRIDIMQEANKQFWKSYGLNSQSFR